MCYTMSQQISQSDMTYWYRETILYMSPKGTTLHHEPNKLCKSCWDKNISFKKQNFVTWKTFFVSNTWLTIHQISMYDKTAKYTMQKIRMGFYITVTLKNVFYISSFSDSYLQPNWKPNHYPSGISWIGKISE